MQGSTNGLPPRPPGSLASRYGPAAASNSAATAAPVRGPRLSLFTLLVVEIV